MAARVGSVNIGKPACITCRNRAFNKANAFFEGAFCFGCRVLLVFLFYKKVDFENEIFFFKKVCLILAQESGFTTTLHHEF